MIGLYYGQQFWVISIKKIQTNVTLKRNNLTRQDESKFFEVDEKLYLVT